MEPVIAEAMKAMNIEGDFSTHTLVFMLILARIIPLMFLTPVLGSRHAPQEVKMGMGMALSVIVYLPVYHSLTKAVPKSVGPFVMLMLKEMLIGMMVGYIISLLFYCVMMCGRIMDTAASRSMAEIQAPHINSRATVLGDLLYMYTIVLFFAVGGHRYLITGILTSFTKFGVLDFALSFPSIDIMSDMLVRTMGDIFTIAVIISSPVLVATFLADVAFGMMNRVAPQLNAYFMAMPVKALGSLIVLLLAWASVSEALGEYCLWIVLKAQEIMQVFGLA